MASTTGIELGPDTCVLAGVRTTRAGGAEIIALHTIEPAAWPAHDVAFADLLRGIRKSKKFPRRTRVVAWGLPEDASNDAVSRAAVRPILYAGFRIDRIVTPPQALAILAATRVRPGVQNTGVVWLALNMHGAAIAIVRGTELLFARTFQWAYNPHLLDGKSQLLQRYSLISHLAPEVRRGIAAVRASHGIQVDAAVTCGDLPELRSLTMPLIEELDLEVETLDSMEGLRPVGKAKFERLAEAAPAIRLACATALGRVQRPRTGPSPLARIAAAAAIVAALGYGAYAYFNRVRKPGPTPSATQTTSRTATKPAVNGAAQNTAPSVPPKLPAEASVKAVSPKLPPQAPVKSEPVPPNLASQAPAKADTPKLTPAASAKADRPKRPPQASAKADGKPDFKPPPQAVAKAEPKAPAMEMPPAKPIVQLPSLAPQKPDLAIAAEQQTRRSTDTRGVVFPPAAKPKNQPRQVPLKDPLPKVDSILIDQERRLAIIDGTVAAVGDQIGPRVIVQIEREAVVLREPSGLLVRIPMRSRQVSSTRPNCHIGDSYIFGRTAVANGRDRA